MLCPQDWRVHYTHALAEAYDDRTQQWPHQLWGTGARAPQPLELVQVVMFTLHVCSVAFPVHVQSHNTL